MTSPFQTILVPHDFSPYSDAAVDLAEQLVELSGARLHLVHAVELPSLHAVTPGGVVALALPSVVAEGALLDAEESLRRVADGARERGVGVHVLEGQATDVICAVAEQLPADLIVMGTHGRTGLAHVLLGSVAERTLRRAPCPVLTVRVQPAGADA
jgi:nucleotide-binding universal stress UspA family protein